MIIIDADSAIAGRLASVAAKKALQGETVAVVNADKAVISGDPKNAKAKYINLRQKGLWSQKGPKVSSMPERMLKRIIRGMIGHKSGKGQEAFKRIKCYNKVPAEFEKSAKIEMKSDTKGITLKELSEALRNG